MNLLKKTDTILLLHMVDHTDSSQLFQIPGLLLFC